ncbi:ies5p [Saccharomyces arboricola H-6]|uniref:Ies5p n=1 Tax=Saccharomyces arboricola (strain H-6 / AS 2.3317 / CBS 10644) TaxID=1160507 RepID=J8Q5R7_SACAR|nr:ies5p [Saccharomyces arboricola H-6]
MPSKDPESYIDKDIRKISSRNDELIKQDATLKREYTTLLRKVSSVITVLNSVDGDAGCGDAEVPRLISESTVEKVPELKWYNKQISLITTTLENEEDIEVPEELVDAYTLYKETSLLYNDTHTP